MKLNVCNEDRLIKFLVNKVLDFLARQVAFKAYLSNMQGSKQVFFQQNHYIKRARSGLRQEDWEICSPNGQGWILFFFFFFLEPWRSVILYVLCVKISPFLKLNITLTIFESRPHQTDSVRWICQVFWEKNKNKDHTQATINKSKLCSGRTSIQLKVALWVKNILEVFLSTTSV